MADKDPNPQDVRRLRSLETDLKALRESSERLATERADLEKRLEEAEQKAAQAETNEGKLQEQIQIAMTVFDGLVEAGVLPTRVQRRTLSSYSENIAKHITSVTERLTAAEARSTELDRQQKELAAQIADRETALRQALEQINDLQKQIDTRVAESEKRTQQLQAELTEAQQTIQMLQDDNQTVSQLIEQNRLLAAQIETMNSDLSVIRGAAEEAKAGLDAARVEAGNLVRAELENQIKASQQQRDTLQAQVNTLTKQLQTEGKTPLLPAEKVSELLGSLVGTMGGNLSGLNIRDGEIRLKVGFGAVGQDSALFIPTTEVTPEIRENLHEVTFRFDKLAVGSSGAQSLVSNTPTDPKDQPRK